MLFCHQTVLIFHFCRVKLIFFLCSSRLGKSVKYDRNKQIMWKYVCNECTSTKQYWKWARTEAANGHIALKADAKIDKN
jgi:hypothetical protein